MHKNILRLAVIGKAGFNMIRRIITFAITLLFAIGLTACNTTPLYDIDVSTVEVIDISDFDFGSGSISDEEKTQKYREYLVSFCQEALKKLEGIEDISLDLEDAEDFKIKVQVAFEEAVGDKDALKEKIEKVIKKLFDEENPLFEIEEVQ